MNTDKLKMNVPDKVLTEITEVSAKFHISTSLRLAHFLAQCAHESGEFTTVVENLNYSKEGLQKTFPKYFPGILAESYARKPELIASRIYANRMGNGDENSKEGWKFRGRGYIQLTGKDNYSAFDKVVPENILDHPELVSEKYPLLSAAWFWDKNKINEIADKGATSAEVAEVTKKINGGSIGLADRIEKFTKYYNLLHDGNDA